MRFKDIIRLIIGAVFIASAILKITSLDDFEIYIYSFGLLPLNISFLFARFVIGIELFLGSVMIASRQKWPAFLSSFTLIGFSLFILYLIISQSIEHCHCFGDAIHLNHVQSILKNIILLLLILLAYRNTEAKGYRLLIPVIIVLFVVSISAPFILSPPDNLRKDQYAKKVSYSETYLPEYLIENNHSSKIKLYCFFGSKCRFCKLAAKKVNVILQKTGFNNTEFVFWGNEETIARFYKENYLDPIPYSTLDGNRFLRITDGNMPLIIVSQGDSVIHKSGYRDLSEKDFITYLSSNQ